MEDIRVREFGRIRNPWGTTESEEDNFHQNWLRKNEKYWDKLEEETMKKLNNEDGKSWGRE